MKNMIPIIAMLASAAITAIALPQSDSAFSYQGELKDNGALANGAYNMEFSLWDAESSGNLIGSIVMIDNVPVSEGRFTVELDFGVAAFDNSDRFLEVEVQGVALSPRQAITRTPYAIQTRGIYVDHLGRVGIGTTLPGQQLQVQTDVRARAVFGHNAATSGFKVGVYGQNDSTAGAGVFGRATSTTGFCWGVNGQSDSPDGRGVVGFASATSGVNTGVYAATNSPDGYAGYFTGPIPVIALQDDDSAGTEQTGYFSLRDSTGSENGWIGYGSPGDADLRLTNHNGDVALVSNSHQLRLETDGDLAVTGSGNSTLTLDLRGDGAQNLRAFALLFDGLAALNIDEVGATQLVRDFNVLGDLFVQGNLSKGGGSFRIDHPLDPENKFLNHSFVESPDMMNVYNGNTVTDERGYATVVMPDWFEALNTAYRYQLTVIGEFALAIIAEEIVDGRFTIRTDKPTVKVSWQVTGIRADPYARMNRIEIEQRKSEDERGYYLHPEAFGLPESRSLHAAPRRANTRAAVDTDLAVPDVK